MDNKIKQAYQHCINIATNHYENFPVASWVLPKALRAPIAAIYAFARQADDIADEGNFTAKERQERLQEMAVTLKACLEGKETNDLMYIAVTDTIQKHSLDVQLFLDLLDAFEQDTHKGRYENFGEIMEYCRRSANPIGRLLLQLKKVDSPKLLGYSDAVCSALQLINFYQDLTSDYQERDRIYVPLDEMKQFKVTEEHFKNQVSDFNMRSLMLFQYKRAEKLLQSGSPLGIEVKGLFAMELRLIILAAQKVVHKLYQQTDLFSRPRLKKSDYINLAWKALWAKGK